MKNSERNLAVIENFILYLTHSSKGDNDFTEPQTYTPEELYRIAYDYIEEDHIDGKGNPEEDRPIFQGENVRFVHDRDYQGYSTICLDIKGHRFESLAVVKTTDLAKLGFI